MRLPPNERVSSEAEVHRSGARVVLRVGVTGHREFPAEHLEAIKAISRTVLERARSAAAAVAEKGYTGYSTDTPLVRVVTSLAEGSDQLLAQAALDSKLTGGTAVETWVILPFPANVYRVDFEAKNGNIDRVNEFEAILNAMDHCTTLDGDRSDLPHRLKAYEQAGRLMLAGCDVLVSICHPKALLKQGGSAQMTQEALSSGMPVVAVNPEDPNEVYLKEMGSNQRFREERFDPQRFEERLRELLTPPEIHDRELVEPRWRAIRDRITQLSELNRWERQLSNIYRLPWKLLLTLSRPEKMAPTSKVDRPATPLRKMYEEAEKRSQQYAILWRGSFMLNYLLGAMAVTCALLQYALQSDGPTWPAAEAITLALLLANYMASRKWCWHAFFGDMRFFAELLRQVRAMSMIGAMVPQIYASDADSAQGRDAWINWYCRALQRSFLPLEANVGEAYRWTVDGWIRKQQSYHEGYAKTRVAMEELLKRGEVLLFASACLACLLHLSGIVPPSRERWLVFIAAAAPAWTAALHAISVQGEFKTMAETSESTARQLQRIGDEASQALQDGSASRAELITTAREASRVMMQEAAGWRTVSQMHQMLPS